MNSNDMLGQLSTASELEGTREEMGDPAEEPDQRWQVLHVQHLLRNEKWRLFLLGVSILLIVIGSLLDIFANTFLPLFVALLVVYLGYRRINTWLNRHV